MNRGLKRFAIAEAVGLRIHQKIALLSSTGRAVLYSAIPVQSDEA
jgi:hypothetical protein